MVDRIKTNFLKRQMDSKEESDEIWYQIGFREAIRSMKMAYVLFIPFVLIYTYIISLIRQIDFWLFSFIGCLLMGIILLTTNYMYIRAHRDSWFKKISDAGLAIEVIHYLEDRLDYHEPEYPEIIIIKRDGGEIHISYSNYEKECIAIVKFHLPFNTPVEDIKSMIDEAIIKKKK